MTNKTKAKLRWIVPMIISIVILLIIGCREQEQEPRADHFTIVPQDTLTFVIVRSIDDNTLELRCLTDSTYYTMIVESAYTPEYYPGIVFTMIKPQ